MTMMNNLLMILNHMLLYKHLSMICVHRNIISGEVEDHIIIDTDSLHGLHHWHDAGVDGVGHLDDLGFLSTVAAAEHSPGVTSLLQVVEELLLAGVVQGAGETLVAGHGSVC